MSISFILPSPENMVARLERILPRFAQIHWVQETTSTNSALMEQARDPRGQILRPWLLGAHYQSLGQGRGGRRWDNTPETQLMFSCAFDVFLPSHQLPTLSPAMGVAACQALRGLLPSHQAEQLSLKWPNDIMWGHSKMAGILTEVTRASASRLSQDHFVVIVGIGINLSRATILSEKLKRPIADWEQLCQTVPQATKHEPEHLVAVIAHRWQQQLNKITNIGFSELCNEFQAVDYLYGMPINILNEGMITQSGIAAGIDSRGQLQVRIGNHTEAISVGAISVRPQNNSLSTQDGSAQAH